MKLALETPKYAYFGHPRMAPEDQILLDDVKIRQVLLRRVPKQVS